MFSPLPVLPGAFSLPELKVKKGEGRRAVRFHYTERSVASRPAVSVRQAPGATSYR